MLDKVTLKEFQAIAGSSANLIIMDGPDVPLKVEEVIPASKEMDAERPKDCRENQWTVVLSGPASHQAPDGTYDLVFEKIGTLEQIYVENRSDNPESEKFNQAHMKTVEEAACKTTDERAEGSVSNDATANPMPNIKTEPRVLYEIYFG